MVNFPVPNERLFIAIRLPQITISPEDPMLIAQPLSALKSAGFESSPILRYPSTESVLELPISNPLIVYDVDTGIRTVPMELLKVTVSKLSPMLPPDQIPVLSQSPEVVTTA